MRMQHSLGIALLVLLCLLNGVKGRGVNVGLCGDTFFDCQCGTGYKINIPIKQCTYFYRWKPHCKPCDDIKQDAFCTTYAKCLECEENRCSKCPPNKYGQWCTGDCACQNGGLCNQADGSCKCLDGYAGNFCEVLTRPSCSTPESPANGRVQGTNYNVGESVTYACDPGFVILGSESRTCTSEMKWSGHQPHCEKTCPIVLLPENLLSEANPFQSSTTVGNSGQPVVKFMKFRCAPGFQLVGSELLTCLPNGIWDNNLPTCKMNCKLPNSPANGLLINSQKTLVDGTKIHYICNKDHILVGSNERICLSNGNWSHPAPTCEKVTYCPDPGTVDFSERRVQPGVGGDFSSGTLVTYSCRQRAILVGQETLECLQNSTWTAEKPSCVFVSDKTITCATKGSEIMAGANVPVRIVCPAGCLKPKPQIWGTVIYKKESNLCASAIHAGMIPRTGGSVSVVNNGIYNNFSPSNSNGIKSNRHRTPSESFRFDFLNDDEDMRCPKGWIEDRQKCVVYINKVAAWTEAVSICQNLASEIVTGNDTGREESGRLFTQVMPRSGNPRIWFGERMNQVWKLKNETMEKISSTLKINPSNSARIVQNVTSQPAQILGNKTKSENSTSENVTNTTPSPILVFPGVNASSDCGVLDSRSGLEGEDCNQKLNFMCKVDANIIDMEAIFCEDPGDIPAGTSEAEGKIDDNYPEGSTVRFRCNPLHFIKGTSRLTCTGNGTWSAAKPSCVKVSACKEPNNIKNGLYNILPSVRTTSGRQASVPRGLSITVQDNPTSLPAGAEKAVIPANFHAVATRVQFSCESKYYNLVGSSTRTCMSDGQWSGRQPTCQPVCGISSAPRSPFIVNGQPTNIGQWPWQVALAQRVENAEASGEVDRHSWFVSCGASLLTESWVVTAAHCVTVSGSTTILSPSNLRLYFGKYFRDDSKDDDWVQIRQIEEIHVYPDFNPVLFDGDIALLRLNDSVKLTSRVQPVCLPDVNSGMSDRHLQAGTIGVVTGWGVDENATYASTLLQADVPVVSSKECEEGYKDAGISLSVSGNMFCAGFQEGDKPDGCSGDSGGPFVMSEGTGVHERWYLEGIVSWGSPVGCGMSRQYGGYTKVATFLDWIQQFI